MLFCFCLVFCVILLVFSSVTHFLCSNTSHFGCSVCRSAFLFELFFCIAAMFDDFRDGQSADGKGIGKESNGTKRARTDPPDARTWLRVYETLPAQLLNAYGIARHVSMSDEEVWGELVKPLKSGAVWMTEYAAKSAERRGVGINRFLMAVLNWLLQQRTDDYKRRNKYVLNPKIYEELYTEIEEIYPAMEYCLAPKMKAAKSGANVLRQSADVREASTVKDKSHLDKYAKQIYEWMNQTTSRVRMLLNFQSDGGLPYGAATYHRATQCFILHGNKFHDGVGNAVCLLEFQEAIQVRHRIGSPGITAGGEGVRDDYA